MFGHISAILAMSQSPRGYLENGTTYFDFLISEAAKEYLLDKSAK